MGAYQDAKFGFGVFFGCAQLMKHSQFLSYTSYNPQNMPERWDIDLNTLSELSWNSRSTPRALQEHSQSSHASQLLISSLHAISEIPIYCIDYRVTHTTSLVVLIGGVVRDLDWTIEVLVKKPHKSETHSDFPGCLKKRRFSPANLCVRNFPRASPGWEVPPPLPPAQITIEL